MKKCECAHGAYICTERKSQMLRKHDGNSRTAFIQPKTLYSIAIAFARSARTHAFSKVESAIE